jgi:2-polyprenyl-3-methyl-5-hydroxy-6-metoxy-1,4-benzoquinol methylase
MTNSCEICNSKKYLVKLLDLGSLPLVDDLIKINSKKKNKLYKTQILYCKKCYTAYQKYNVKKKILFPDKYHYRSSLTNDVIMGMEGLVKDTKKFVKTYKNKVVLDVGCNDGTLLSRFKKEKAVTIGIEPTGAANEAKKKGHDVYKNYIDMKTVNRIKKKYEHIDIITFTHVFAHIDNLKYLISCVAKLMSKNTILVIENHYLGSVLDQKQFDTFYHEHPRTYSQRSFLEIAKKIKANLIHCSFPKRYGGNIRVVITKSKKNKIKIKNENFFFHKFTQLQSSMEKWKKRKKEELLNLSKKYGPLSAKAFPGRASILIKLLNINDKVISEVFEKPNSKKIGHYLPGTTIPIKSDNKFIQNKNKIKIIINLAWHINKEIKIYLRKMGYKGKIIDILDSKDFK